MKRLVGAVLTAALTAACGPGVAAAEKPESITVAYFPEWPTANQVAQAERWYDEEMGLEVRWRQFQSGVDMAQAERWYDEEMGLEVRWRQFQSGVDMARAMVAGEVEISYSMGIIPFIGAVSDGAPLTAVGIAVSYAENDNCVVHRKAAIDKANAHELEGKKVAVPFGTVTHYKLLRTLDFLAVDTTKLDLVDMVSAEGAKALARGEVTMACGWGGALRRMLGKNQVLMSAREQTKIGIRTFDVVAVTNEFAENHPDLVTAFLKVSDRAADYLDDSPDEARPIIAGAAGLDLKQSNILLARFQFYTRNAQLTGTWMRGGVQAFAKEVADFMAGQGVLARALDDYGPTFNAGFYEGVR